MRVLMVIGNLGGGGAERVACILARHWCDDGHDVALLTIGPRSGDAYEVDPRVNRFALDLAAPSRGAIDALRASLKRIIGIRRAMRDWRADVLLAFTTRQAVLGILAAIGDRCRVIACERTFPPYAPVGKVFRILRRALYRHAAAVVCQTEDSAAWVRAHCGACRVFVIPNPLLWPLGATAPGRIPDDSIAPNLPVLLAAGRLSPEKGFELLIDAFADVACRHPHWVLTILGEGPERARLERRVQEVGLADRVLLPGFVGNIADWYARADLFVLSSRFEGFPNALLEAMASGCAVISTRCVAGPTDLVQDGVDGVLVQEGDVASLACALDRLMSDAALRAHLGWRATEARQRFSLDAVGRHWAALLEGSCAS